MIRIRTFVLVLVASTPAAAQVASLPVVPPTATAQPAQPVTGISQTQLQGSVAREAVGPPVTLTLLGAIERGLKNNLGILVRDTGNQTARAARIKALSALMPQVTGTIAENAQQTNLQALGINIPFAPKIVGPFGYTDLRANASATVFDWTAFKNLKAAAEGQKAAELSLEDARDLVVQAVASAFFQITASAARVDSIKAQVETAQLLYDRAVDQKKAGTSPGIDVLRAQVELKSQQQQLLAQRNQLAKDKLVLGRAIGLPGGQEFEIGGVPAFSPVPIAVDQAIERALKARRDYQSLQAQVRGAEQAKRAAKGERYPSVGVAGNYGDIGPNVGRSHGTFGLTGSVKFNIFDGGRIKGDVEQADATLRQRQNELGDLRGRIEYEVRTAVLDLKSAEDQVEVARSNVGLAEQTLAQSKDRFAAGVTDNLEVVQAQQTLAAANQNYISALFSHNLAKVSLARAVGAAETALQEFIH